MRRWISPAMLNPSASAAERHSSNVSGSTRMEKRGVGIGSDDFGTAAHLFLDSLKGVDRSLVPRPQVVRNLKDIA